MKVAAGHDLGTAPLRKALVMVEAATKRLTEIFTNEFGFPVDGAALGSTRRRKFFGAALTVRRVRTAITLVDGASVLDMSEKRSCP